MRDIGDILPPWKIFWIKRTTNQEPLLRTPLGRLQEEGARSFVKSWNELMSVIASKSAVLKKAS